MGQKEKPMNPSTPTPFCEEILAGRKIDAIKLLRNFIGTIDGLPATELKECLDFVSNIQNRIFTRKALKSFDEAIDSTVRITNKDVVIQHMENWLAKNKEF